jgi:hypothetical protein
MSDPATKPVLKTPLKRVILSAPIEIEEDRIFVKPSTVRIGRGDSKLKTILFVNQTGGDVYIWHPNALNYLDGQANGFLEPVLIHTVKEKAFEVKMDCKDGYYHYNVYCKSIEGYAEGNSEPGVECP